MMVDLVKIDEAVLQERLTEIETKIAGLEVKIGVLSQVQMPDTIKLSLKDVLTWLLGVL